MMYPQSVVKDQEYDYFYDNEKDAKYCYPGTNILKNKLNIKDPDILHKAERDYSSVRQAELATKGVTVDISKGTMFCLVQFIEAQFDDLYRKLKKENFLADITDKKEMSHRLAYYLGELNMIHPFREGHGRTQRIYIEQLCQNNGRFEIDFTESTKEEMVLASIRSANESNDLLEELINKCLIDISNASSI